METPPHDKPGRLVLDFAQPMRPKERRRFKIISGREKPPSSGTLAFPDRPELYEVFAAERAESGSK